MTCQPGWEFDKLVKVCVLNADRKPQQATERAPVPRASDSAPSQHAAVVSPFVWISVVVVVNCTILALFLWFIIYRRQRRNADAAADTKAESSPGVQQAGRTDSVDVEREELHTSSPHLNGGPKGLLKQEASTWRDASECDAGGGGCVHTCNGRKEHWIPLPATELGVAALVTAKTAVY